MDDAVDGFGRTDITFNMIEPCSISCIGRIACMTRSSDSLISEEIHGQRCDAT